MNKQKFIKFSIWTLFFINILIFIKQLKSEKINKDFLTCINPQEEKKKRILTWFENDVLEFDNGNFPLNRLSGWKSDSDTYNSVIIDSISKMNPPIKDGSKIFEFGCGVGASLKCINEYYKKSLKLGGSDFSNNAIIKIKEIFPSMKKNFIKLSMTEKHPLKSNSQDYVVSFGAVGMYLYKNEMLIAIKEMVRITKPGGSLCITHFIHPEGKHVGSILDKVEKDFWLEPLKKMNLENIQIHIMHPSQADRYLIVCNKKK